MSRISECYASLENAKNELVSLEMERDRFDKLFRMYYSFDIEGEKDISIKVLMERFEAQHKELKKRLILIFGLAYPAVLAFWTIIGIIFNFKPSSAFVSCCSSVFFTTNMDNFSKCRKLRAKRKYLDEAMDYLGNKEENLNLSAAELIVAMNVRDVELNEKIVDRRRAIDEYEKLLSDVSCEVANEIIESHGIDAEITLEARKKTKSLIKINVNK